MHLQHVMFGGFTIPTENLFKDMHHVRHQIDGVVPTNHEPRGLKFGTGIRLLLTFNFRQYLGLSHGEKLEVSVGLVEGGRSSVASWQTQKERENRSRAREI